MGLTWPPLSPAGPRKHLSFQKDQLCVLHSSSWTAEDRPWCLNSQSPREGVGRGSGPHPWAPLQCPCRRHSSLLKFLQGRELAALCCQSLILTFHGLAPWSPPERGLQTEGDRAIAQPLCERVGYSQASLAPQGYTALEGPEGA